MAVYPTFSKGAILRGWQLRATQVEIIEASNDFSATAQSISVFDPELNIRLERDSSYLLEATLLFRATVDTGAFAYFDSPIVSQVSGRVMSLGPSDVAANVITANEARLSLWSTSSISNFGSGHQVNGDSIDHVINKTAVIHTNSIPQPVGIEFFKDAATGVLTRSTGSFLVVTRFA